MCSSDLALILRRVDELRPASLRMLVSMMGMRTLPREADAGAALADCTVIATAVALPRRMHVLRRMFPLVVELPPSCAEARTAAAFRAAQALGVAGSPGLRAALAARVAAMAGALEDLEWIVVIEEGDSDAPVPRSALRTLSWGSLCDLGQIGRAHV